MYLTDLSIPGTDDDEPYVVTWTSHPWTRPAALPILRGYPEARAARRCHDERVALTLLIVDDHPGFRGFARDAPGGGGTRRRRRGG